MRVTIPGAYFLYNRNQNTDWPNGQLPLTTGMMLKTHPNHAAGGHRRPPHAGLDEAAAVRKATAARRAEGRGLAARPRHRLKMPGDGRLRNHADDEVRSSQAFVRARDMPRA